MSIEQNKKDFESALSALEDVKNELDGIISNDFIAALADVIGDYNGHLGSDIEALIKREEELEDEVTDLKVKNEELEKAI